jgi:serine/threonine protein kinase
MVKVLGDRYEIKQQLSQKAGRQTLLALDRETGEQVVVKLLTFSSEFEWETLKLFEREIQILKTLSHPKIPRYLNSFELDGQDNKGFALVQTYIEASPLESHIKSGRTFSEIEIKQVAESLLETLIYLHSQLPPVIHRDIKPSNVLLADRSGNRVGQVYLVDFGSVQTVVSKDRGTFTVVGTYGYMPPEQFSGRTTPVSDLYSLGAILIHLVTGQHPADLMTDDLQLEFEYSPMLSAELAHWIQRMVQPVPSKRFATAKEALQALKNPNFGVFPSIGKPAHSPIQLERQNEELRIRLFPQKNIKYLLPLLFLVSFTPLGIGMILWSAFSWISFCLFKWLKGAEIQEVIINRSYVSFKFRPYGLIPFLIPYYHTRSFSKEQVSYLEVMGTHYRRGSEMDTVYCPANITIWVGSLPVEIGNLNDAEATWLSQKLSESLNVPMKQLSLIK